MRAPSRRWSPTQRMRHPQHEARNCSRTPAPTPALAPGDKRTTDHLSAQCQGVQGRKAESQLHVPRNRRTTEYDPCPGSNPLRHDAALQPSIRPCAPTSTGGDNSQTARRRCLGTPDGTRAPLSATYRRHDKGVAKGVDRATPEKWPELVQLTLKTRRIVESILGPSIGVQATANQGL